MKGFDGQGSVEPGDDFELALDAVYGCRWWMLPRPPVSCWPHQAGERWTRSLLRGSFGYDWNPGRNEAVCRCENVLIVNSSHLVPVPDCGCGFWAYWDLQKHSTGTLPVCGIVKGTGRTLIGERGFRSQYAEIVALHVPPSAGLTLIAPGIKFIGRSPNRKIKKDEEILAAAWMAVIGDRLAQLYPGAVIYETQRAMLASHPLNGKSLLPPPPLAAPFVSLGSDRIVISRGLLCADPAAHPPGCPCKVPWITPPPASDLSLTGDGALMIISHGTLCASTQSHPDTCSCLLTGRGQ